MLTNPTIETLKSLKLHGMIQALEEQQENPVVNPWSVSVSPVRRPVPGWFAQCAARAQLMAGKSLIASQELESSLMHRRQRSFINGKVRDFLARKHCRLTAFCRVKYPEPNS